MTILPSLFALLFLFFASYLLAQPDAKAELLWKLIPICKDNGIVLYLHNHTCEVENNPHNLKGTLSAFPTSNSVQTSIG